MFSARTSHFYNDNCSSTWNLQSAGTARREIIRKWKFFFVSSFITVKYTPLQSWMGPKVDRPWKNILNFLIYWIIGINSFHHIQNRLVWANIEYFIKRVTACTSAVVILPTSDYIIILIMFLFQWDLLDETAYTGW